MRRLALCFAAVVAVSCPVALAQNSNHEVTPTQYVTEEELAALYVLSELCPSLVENKTAFEQGYENFVQSYLPELKQPLVALKHFAQQTQSAPILLEAQQDAKQAGTVKNREICQELTTYRK
ncbi:hypothetical protein [Acinetobacter sp. B51(2017)]|uniref:MCR_0457 family protein n=1 Tax=Acinetobacter sp. B51(2017) TaxID=2060938 RepID=UPI000F079D55|nr:hypothetical protein [Acinetobacter sp. B51(2017)]